MELDPNSLVDLDLAAGTHRLDLLGVAEHCSTAPSTSQRVDVQADRTTTASFEIDDYTRYRLLNGLDDISITLSHDDDIVAFEKSRPTWKPVTQ